MSDRVVDEVLAGVTRIIEEHSSGTYHGWLTPEFCAEEIVEFIIDYNASLGRPGTGRHRGEHQGDYYGE
jgi:hypothetical protein